MTAKRFIFEQNGNFHTVMDTVENKPMGVFEFKENEFPAYACFHMIIDKMNELHEENNELRLMLNSCFDQKNEFHRGARENANCVGKLKKENEQLKAINKYLIEILEYNGATVEIEHIKGDME